MFDFKLMKINKLFTDFNLSLFFTSFKRCIKWPDFVSIFKDGVYSGTADFSSI